MATPPLFPLADDPAADPLDVSGFGPAQPQQAPAALDPEQRKQWLKLALILPLAMKAGPGAVTGLLGGWSQAQQRNQATQQTNQQHQQRIDQQAASAKSLSDYRAQSLAGQADARKTALLKQAMDAIGGAQSDVDVRAALELYAPQLQALGVRPGALEGYALQTQTPDRLTQRKVQAIWDKYPAELKSEVIKSRGTLNVNGQAMPFDQWAGMVGAPSMGPQAAGGGELSKSSLDVQAADALRRGDTATYEQLKKVADEMGTARRADADPALRDINRQIAQLRLENMRGTKDTTGLPPRIQRQVDALSKGFDSQAVTKRTQVMAEAVSFAEGLDPNTKNPADDQAIIYSFAKAMDPDSVVREGEYATVQKYAQAWAESFGFDVARIFSNTAFLTPHARANMKATIKARYTAARGQYDNVRSEYADRINRMTGGQDGADYLIDYGAAFPGTTGTSARQPATTLPDGTKVRRVK